MSTLKAISIQHPSAANAAITLDANSGLSFSGNLTLTNATIGNAVSFSNTVTFTSNVNLAKVNTAANSSTGVVGQVLTSNGSGNMYWSTISASGSLVSYNVYTSTQTITIPTGATSAEVTMVGPGGGGASAIGGCNPSTGTCGGAGGALQKRLTGLTAGSTLSLTVGSGGAAGANGSADTVLASGTQSITTLTGAKGIGGPYGGAGGTATNGDININGQSGPPAWQASTGYYTSGGAAPGFGLGSPGIGHHYSATGYGAGGGGGGLNDFGAAQSGTAGSGGICIITWYR